MLGGAATVSPALLLAAVAPALLSLVERGASWSVVPSPEVQAVVVVGR